jgi:hypothetical protein
MQSNQEFCIIMYCNMILYAHPKKNFYLGGQSVQGQMLPEDILSCRSKLHNLGRKGNMLLFMESHGISTLKTHGGGLGLFIRLSQNQFL